MKGLLRRLMISLVVVSFIVNLFDLIGVNQDYIVEASALDEILSATLDESGNKLQKTDFYEARTLELIKDSNIVFNDVELERNNSVARGLLSAVAYGNGVYVAVGESGIIKYSEDGLNWKGADSKTTNNLNDVVFNGEQFVTVGRSGTVRVSNNGKDWTSSTPNSSFYQEMSSVAWGNNRFVATGYYGEIWTSLDGFNWEAVQNDSWNKLYDEGIVGQNCELVEIIFENGQFLVMGYNLNSSIKLILKSSDGLHWDISYTTYRDDNKSYEDFSDILWDGKQYIVIDGQSNLLISSDGLNWKKKKLPLDHGNKKMVYVNNQYVLIGKVIDTTPYYYTRTTVFVSDDLLSWIETDQIAIESWGDYQDMKYLNDSIIAPNNSGKVTIVNRNFNKTVETGVTNSLLTSGCYANETYVITPSYDRSLLISKDGDMWESLSMNYSYEQVIHLNQQFIAVGSGAIATSKDGLTWNETKVNHKLESIAYGNGRYVAVGYEGAAYISNDGENWSFIKTTITDEFKSIVFNGEFFIGVTYEGTIYKTSDGEKWSIVYNDSNARFSDIIWDGRQFIAGGNLIYTSFDGLNWINRTLVGDPMNDYLSVEVLFQIEDTYVALGSFGKVMISTDGQLWSKLNSQTLTNFHYYDLFEGKDGVIALTDNGGIYKFKLISKGSSSLVDTGWEMNRDISHITLNSVEDNKKGTIVTVGELGIIRLSHNGEDWITVEAGIRTNLNTVRWIKDRFYIVGDEGILLTSIDGYEWDQTELNITRDIYDIGSNGQSFVIVGEEGLTLYSKDGINFELMTSNCGRDLDLKSVIYFKGRYYTVGSDGWWGRAFVSEDGMTWEPIFEDTTPYSNFINITTDEKTLVISTEAGLISSRNGNDWSFYNHGNGWNTDGNIIYNGDFFAKYGFYSHIWYSFDGISWQEAKGSNNYFSGPRDVIKFNNQYVGINSQGEIGISKDAIDWEKIKLGVYAQHFQAITYGKGKYLIGGNYDTLLYSADAREWNEVESDFPTILSLANNGQVFVAGGVFKQLHVSRNGIEWETVTAPVLDEFAWITDVKWCGDKFVAVVDSGEILISEDGYNWDISTTLSEDIIDQDIVYFDENIYIFANTFKNHNQQSTILKSSNAVDWKTHELPYAISSMIAGEDGLVAITIDNEVLVSQDGLNWKISSKINRDYGLGNSSILTFNGDEYMILGMKVFKSKDLKGWDMYDLDGVFMDNNEVYWNGSQYLAVGNQTSILTKAYTSNSKAASTSIKPVHYIQSSIDETVNYQLEALVYDQFSNVIENQELEWSTFSEFGVEIDQNGILTIPATTVSGRVIVNVKVRGQDHTNSSITIYVGESPMIQFNEDTNFIIGNAMYLYDLFTLKTSSNVSWEISDPEVAEIDTYGTLMFKEVGETELTIYMHDGGYSNSIMIKVTDPIKEDLNQDGVIDEQDLELIESYYHTIDNEDYDLNGDGIIDVYDFVLISSKIK